MIKSSIKKTSANEIAPLREQGRIGTRLRSQLLAVLFLPGILIAIFTAFRNEIGGYFKPNVAAEAREYLRDKNVTPISESLNDLLTASASIAIPSQPHQLVGKPAPRFALPNDHGEMIELQSQIDQGCVVLIFYYGYHCNHCVGQLFAVNDDLKKFQEIGARVLAVSADEITETQKRFDEYGRFKFPVLSDLGNAIAGVYGIYQPAQGEELEQLEHATFVIDDKGIICWANYGDEPFTDNKTLLVEIAKAQGRIPGATTPPANTNSH